PETSARNPRVSGTAVNQQLDRLSTLRSLWRGEQRLGEKRSHRWHSLQRSVRRWGQAPQEYQALDSRSLPPPRAAEPRTHARSGNREKIGQALERRLAAGRGAPDQSDGQRRHSRGRADDAVLRRLGERESRDQADAEAARNVGEKQRHARDADRRHRADPRAGEVLLEHGAAPTLGGQAQDRLATQPLRQWRPVASLPPRAHPDERLIEEVPALEAAWRVLPGDHGKVDVATRHQAHALARV